MPVRLIGIRRDGESRPALYPKVKKRPLRRGKRLRAKKGEALTADKAPFTMRPVGKAAGVLEAPGSTTREWWNGRHARLRIWCLAA